jgi:hypothetical protein
MYRRRQWQLAALALALALAAGAARAQTGSTSSGSSSHPGTTPAVTWKFTTTREGGESRLQMQAGEGAMATCESITLRMAGTPVTLTTDGRKVRVQSGPGKRGRLQASADRVSVSGASGEMLTLTGSVQVRFESQGQCAQIIKGARVVLNLSTCGLQVEGAGELTDTGRAPVNLDFGFPVAPAAEKDKEQTFNFFLGFTR